MKVIGLRTKNKDICKETVRDAGFRRFSMVNTGFYVPAGVTLLWEWVHEDLGHPKSVRGQGNLNLVALPRVPDELDEKAELVLDFDQFKQNAQTVHSDLLSKRIDKDERTKNHVYLPPEKIEEVKPDLFDGVLIDSREVPEERTRKKGNQDKADPEFDLQEGDLCSYQHLTPRSEKTFPVVVNRRTSRNVWIEPVKFTGLPPTSGMRYSETADEDEIEILEDEDGKPLRRNCDSEKFPKRFFINKDGRWEAYGTGGSYSVMLVESIRAKEFRDPR